MCEGSQPHRRIVRRLARTRAQRRKGSGVQGAKRWLGCVLAAACATQAGTATLPQPNTLERAALSRQARRVAETWMRAHPPQQLAWSWGEGVLGYGLWRLYLASGHEPLRAYLVDYLRAHDEHGVRVSFSDDTTPGLVAAELALAGDPTGRALLDRVVAYVMAAPRTETQGLIRHLGLRYPPWLAPRRWFPDIWVDSLFHFAITLCRYSRITGDARYRREAAMQLQGFLRNLQDPQSGLVTHAYNDEPRDERVPPFADRKFWARGNGWALVALVEVLAELPAQDPMRPELAARARRLAAALRPTMHAQSGLFSTLLLAPESYLETAGSALIVYGLAFGARTGVLSAADADAAQAGMRGLVAVLEERPDGLEVSGTSLGTNPSARRYARVGRRNQVSYGVGAWLLAASMFLDATPP
jgi:rhamnogalacturonyl hydrolase YesR